ncbi:c-type cytochrome [Tranquillimonas alkanivorans]|uniref:Cytochrome C oxidase, cbb3-type, subunit III n=1 Tax=Tranquillimonas alkanivorans TaxID=441119 RepID=A0A1I5T4S9_9RHOB|nr:cytochrome c [Tranquillimonas alkanivorans]SFP78029.1 Cytochrome C oxidase, cbb3-type, subunit III [Tranquillimonas alkanivorans]
MRLPNALFRLLIALGLSALPAGADDLGQEEFKNSCAVCHGASGMGDGPLAPVLTVPVSDLTTIEARNDGEFPLLHIIQVIDGRTGIRGHGYPMPVWGARFKAEEIETSGPYAAEIIVRGRVLSLAYYLESLQETPAPEE